MAKNLKALIIALALIALLAGGYQGARIYQEAKAKARYETASYPETIPLTSFSQEKLARLEFPAEGFALERKAEELWEAVPAFPGPLNQSETRSLAWSLAGIRAERIIEENPPDLSLYGLDAPAGRLIISTGDGERVELTGGGMNPTRTGYYVMVPGDPKVYLVPSYSARAIFLDPESLRDRELTAAFEPGAVGRFILESGGGRIDIVPRPEDAALAAPFSTHIMTAPYERSRGVDSEKFTALLEGLQNLRISRFIDPKPASLGPYGLDKPLRVFLETPEGSFDLLLGNSENGERYAQRRGEAEVFTIAEIDALRTVNPFTLADKFALILNIDTVDNFSVRGGGPALTGEIRRQGEGDGKVETYYFNGKQAEEKSFKAWYQTVIGLLADAEHPQRPQRGGAAEITIEYNLNKPAGERASIRLIPYNRDFYALEAGGVIEFLISRPQVRALYEAAEKMVYIE
jgi:hypothetical protein